MQCIAIMTGNSDRNADTATAVARAVDLARDRDPGQAGNGVPVWVHLLPAGSFGTRRDSRGPFALDDPAAVIAATEALRMDLPIDYEHATDFAAPKGQPAPAAGWINQIEARTDGLWGRVEWTDKGRAHIAAREYRYLSPVFEHEKKTGKVLRLLRAALTNDPALVLKAVASTQSSSSEAIGLRTRSDMDEDDLKRIAEALGLGDDADADTIVTTATSLKEKADKAEGDGDTPDLTAIAKAAGLKEDAEPAAIATAVAALRSQATAPDPKKFVPAEQVAALSTRLEELEGDKAEAVVDKAIEDGKLVPALRDWGLSVCKSDRKGFDAYLEKAPVILDGKTQVDPTKQPKGGGALSDSDLAICRATGVDPEAFKKTRDAEKEVVR